MTHYYPTVIGTSDRKSMEKDSSPVTFLDIIRSKFHQDIEAEVREYIQSNPQIVREAANLGKEETVQMQSLALQDVRSILGQPTDRVIVDVIVSCNFGVMKGGTTTYKRQDFRVRYCMNMNVYQQSLSPARVGPANERLLRDPLSAPGAIRLNNFMLPLMSLEDYDTAAYMMLYHYDRASLDSGAVADPMLLAEKMGQKVLKVRFVDEPDVQGRIYFDYTHVRLLGEDGEVKTITVPPCTILINMEACETEKDVDDTIRHELSHLFLDRYFFLLQLMAGKPYTSYTSRKRTKKRIPKWKRTEIDWMEHQAEKLPIHIMMEESGVRHEVDELLEIRGNKRSPANMYHVMQMLVVKYGVSAMMAKIRLVELGYQEAEGIWNFIADNKGIRYHSCVGEWPKGVRYAISFKEFVEQLQHDN